MVNSSEVVFGDTNQAAINDQIDLPDSWQSRKDLPEDQFCIPWDTLRPFFERNGYELFECKHVRPGRLPTSGRQEPPASDSFGLFGDRGESFTCIMEPVNTVFAARDSLNRDVVIKVVAKGTENIRELEILQLLNSEPLKSHPSNATVPILEFLNFRDWSFAVMPFCDESFEPVMQNADESLEFAEQILRGLAFLHENRIAHMDISHENIVINHHGIIPQSTIFHQEILKIEKIWPPPVFRTFPIRYLLLDFGISYSFPPTLPLSGCVAARTSIGRRTQGPEVMHGQFNPFAADVYQTAMLFYDWLHNLVPDTVPGFLPLLQDMSSFYPPERPSMATALERLVRIREELPESNRFAIGHDLEPGRWKFIPRPFLRSVREIFLTRGWRAVVLFTNSTRYAALLARYRHLVPWLRLSHRK